MANMFFFTDIDLLNNQVSNQAYGPAGTTVINNVTYDRFRITSVHSASSNPNAYAVCNGTVFIQNDLNNSNLVHLILKPTLSPSFDFPKIKLIIYKGILKSSLINGSDIAASTSNDLTQSIWDSQNAINQSANTNDNPPDRALGIDLSSTLLDTDFIIDVFYRSNISFQFPNVNGGWSIGTFDKTKFGIEVVLDNSGYDPTLIIARNLENFVMVSALTGSETQPQFFEHWHDKEEVLNYVDPCALWGLFYHAVLSVKNSLQQIADKSGNSVYDDVIAPTFFNKNTTYLDIRNEYNFSLNYFKNYGTDFYLATDTTSSPASRNHYISLWPITILSSSDFPNGNISSANIIRLQLPDGNGDNTLPVVYVSSGFLTASYPNIPIDKDRLISTTVTSGLTGEISLSTANRDGQNSVMPVSGYIRIKFLKKFDTTQSPPVSSGTVIRAATYLDNIFSPSAMRILFSSTNNIRSCIYDDETYIDMTEDSSKELIVRTGIAEDTKNITFYAYPLISNSQVDVPATSPFSLPAITSPDSSDIFMDFVVKLYSKEITKFEYSLTPTNIPFLTVSNSSNEIVSDFQQPNFDEFISLAIDKNTEYSTFANVITSNFLAKYRVYLGVANPSSGVDNDGYSYLTYDIMLRGFEINSGNLQVKEVNTNIKLYV